MSFGGRRRLEKLPLPRERNTLDVITVGEEELDVIFIPVLCLFNGVGEVFELRGGAEVAIVVDVDDGELWVFFVVVHDVVVVVDLVVSQGSWG